MRQTLPTHAFTSIDNTHYHRIRIKSKADCHTTIGRGELEGVGNKIKKHTLEALDINSSMSINVIGEVHSKPDVAARCSNAERLSPIAYLLAQINFSEIET